MQCAVTHSKEKEHKNFPPVFCSQDIVHSKQHLRSLLRELRCALFLCSHTFSKNVIFQRKSVRDKGREDYHFLTECYGCTLSPVLKASYSQEVLHTCADAHIATAHLRFFPALLPVTTAVQKYDLHRYLPLHPSSKCFVVRYGKK